MSCLVLLKLRLQNRVVSRLAYDIPTQILLQLGGWSNNSRSSISNLRSSSGSSPRPKKLPFSLTVFYTSTVLGLCLLWVLFGQSSLCKRIQYYTHATVLMTKRERLTSNDRLQADLVKLIVNIYIYLTDRSHRFTMNGRTVRAV